MAETNPILARAKKQAGAATPSQALTDVQGAIGASTVRITDSIKQLESNVNKTQTQTSIITSAVSEAAAATQITQLAADNASLSAQNKTIEAFEAAGGHETQVQLMTELRADGARVSELLDQKADIVDDEFTGIALIDTVINEFRTLQLDANINVAQAQQDQSIKQIQNIGAATETQSRNSALTKQTLNQGVIQANYDNIAAEGAIRAAEAELKGMSANADAMLRLVNADQRGVSNLLQVFRLEGEAEARALATERHAFQKEQMGFAREKWKVELPAAKVNLQSAQLRLKTATTTNSSDIQAALANNAAAVKRHEDAVATEITLVDSVQRAQALSGVPVDDRETIVWGLGNSDRTVRDKYVRLQEIGGVANPVLGQTPFDARESLSLIDPSGNAELTPGIVMLNEATKVLVEKYQAAPNGAPKDDEAIKSDFNNSAEAVMQVAAKDIRAGDASNPYQAPGMDVLATHKAVADSTFYKKVIAPMAMKETNPQRIFDAAVAGMFAKTVSPEEAAAGIEAIFDAAALHNNTFAGGFRRVGLPNQVTYNTSIHRAPTSFEKLKVGGSILLGTTGPIDMIRNATGGTSKVTESAVEGLMREVKVDLMNPTSIKAMLTRLLSTQAPAPKPAEAEAKDNLFGGVIRGNERAGDTTPPSFQDTTPAKSFDQSNSRGAEQLEGKEDFLGKGIIRQN